jgi:drug/metabolite transporter (DMT)-like permease
LTPFLDPGLAMAESSANYRGILAMVGACAFFSANDAATKIATQYLPVSEIVTIRAVFTLLFAFLFIVWRSELAALPHIRNPYLLLRGLCEALTGVLIIYGLSLMPLANVTAILLVQPFLLTMVGMLYLGEDVGWRRWLAVCAGFIGMLLVIKPGTEAFDATSLIVVAAAFCVLGRDLLVRKIHSEVPTTVITFSTALLTLPLGLIGLLFQPWSLPPLYPLLICIVAAAFLVIAFVLMIVAFRSAQVSAVSPFRYSIIVFSVVYGYLVFGNVPDATSFVGIGIIVFAGLYSLHRETVRKQTIVKDPVVANEPPH